MRVVIAALFIVACGAPAEAPKSPEAKPVAASNPQVAPQANPAPTSGTPAAPAAPAAPQAAPAAAGDWAAYGAAFPADGAILPVKQVLDAPASFAGKTVTVEGDIADVCQKKGCWMVVSDGARTMRVTMKEHGFGVDMGSTGGKAQIHGELVAKKVDPKTVAHYASEAAKPDLVPESAAANGENFELVATAVRVRKAQ